MRLSDLQTKEVVNISDGKRVGVIIDVLIEPTSSKIKGFILEERKGKKFFGGLEESEISFEQIIKIGEDVILVDSKKNMYYK